VDYTCGGDFKKLVPGSVRCELGQWKPNRPACLHPSMSDPFEQDGRKGSGGKKGGGKPDKYASTPLKRSCGSPPKEKGAYTFVNGLPVDWESHYRYKN
jgi:hypothetical protein